MRIKRSSSEESGRRRRRSIHRSLVTTFRSHGALVNIVVLLLLVVEAQTQTTANDPCTLCYGGTDFDKHGMIGSMSCRDIAQMLNSTNADTQVCYDMQLQGYLYCSCETYPQDIFCSMCEGGSINVTNPKASIDGTTTTTCQESLFAKKVDNHDCRAIVKAATVCGCPDGAASAPDCSFCNAGSIAYPARVVPPDFLWTCEDYENVASSLARYAQCMDISSDSTVNARAYCGCSLSSSEQEEFDNNGKCASLCDQGLVLVNHNETIRLNNNDDESGTDSDAQSFPLTCQEIYDMAPFVVDETYCKTIQKMAAKTCCGELPAQLPSKDSTSDTPRKSNSTTAPLSTQSKPTAAPVEATQTKSRATNIQWSLTATSGRNTAVHLICMVTIGMLAQLI